MVSAFALHLYQVAAEATLDAFLSIFNPFSALTAADNIGVLGQVFQAQHRRLILVFIGLYSRVYQL